MSADDGIYVLKTPTKSENFEYRVAWAQAIENVEIPPADQQQKYMKMLFGKSEVYHDEDVALLTAAKMLKNCQYPPEYGMKIIEVNVPFPS
jgi:hypothetical protein